MFLSQEERDLFRRYLDEEISSDKMLIEQMKKLPGMDLMIRAKAIDVAAMSRVSQMLSSITEEVINESDSHSGL